MRICESACQGVAQSRQDRSGPTISPEINGFTVRRNYISERTLNLGGKCMRTCTGRNNVEKLIKALRNAISEHGTPNVFYPRELWLDYGAPHQIIIGSMLRSSTVRDFLAEHIGMPITYTTPIGAGHRIVVGELDDNAPAASPGSTAPSTQREE